MSGSEKVRVPGMELELEEMGAMGYQQTLMYGRYSRSLSDQIKEEAKRHQLVENRSKEYKSLKKELRGIGECYQKTARVVTFIWKHTFARIGEDWVILALLGMIMALVAMDYSTSNQARLWLVKDLVSSVWLQFLAFLCSWFFSVQDLFTWLPPRLLDPAFLG
jgi:chloride channel 2